MGTWGSGNFDSDTAADHLAILTGRLISEVTDAMSGDPVEIEPDEYWGVAVPCNLELLHLIARQNHVGAVHPSRTRSPTGRPSSWPPGNERSTGSTPNRDTKRSDGPS